MSIEDEPGLVVLPSGTIPPNSADLLSAGRMGEVLSLLRESADIVIVDSRRRFCRWPTRGCCSRLAEVDGVIVVGRAGFSRRDRLRLAVRVLEQSGKRVFGLVITDAKGPTRSGYYYDERPSSPNGHPRQPSIRVQV